MNTIAFPVHRARRRALPRVPGLETPGRAPGPAGRIAEYEFRELVERMAEVCWEATRAHIRSELDSSTALDPNVPPKWVSACPDAQQLSRVAVLAWWNGSVEPAEASAITHVCRAIVLEYKRQWMLAHGRQNGARKT